MNTQFSMPEAGCHIAITFAFPSYVLGHEGINETTITGIVEKATKFTPPNFVRLVTDFDSPVRIREISLHRVTNIEYNDGRAAGLETAKDDTQTWVVEGSRGSRYTVVRAQHAWTCTCPGYQFRKTCKHVTELKNA